jgi:hypothetical protein
MSKRLLRKLLNLNTESDKTSTSNVSDDMQNLKYAQYYSTDKSRNVLTKIPNKMSIKYKPTSILNTSNTYSDNLSDVDSKLLTHIISKDSKPVTYYSTDKGQYTTAFAPRKVDVINDLSDLSTDAIVDIYESQDDESDSLDSRTFLYNNNDKKNDKKINKKNSYRYSDSTNESSKSSDKDSYISEPSSIYSKDLSNKSSYNSDSNTSYDSFYDDDSVKQKGTRVEDLLDLYKKDNYFDTRVKKYDLEDLLELNL